MEIKLNKQFDIIDEIKTVPYGRVNTYNSCSVTKDRKGLYLNYFSLDSNCVRKDHNQLFDHLSLYDTLEILIINSDFFYELPENVAKFNNLKFLGVHGSRFWDLDMTRIPPSIKTLDLTEHSNLSANCFKGMDRLIHLKELLIDDVFDILHSGSCLVQYDCDCDGLCDCNDYSETKNNYTSEIPIPYLPSLKTITLCVGIGFVPEGDKRNKWISVMEKRIRQHPDFTRIVPHIERFCTDKRIVWSNISMKFKKYT